MTRRGIWAVILTTLVLLAVGASQTLAGKGGNKGGGNGGGGGAEPPADPAIAVVDVKADALVVMNDDGSSQTVLLTFDEAGGSIGAPDWSPDGGALVFSIYDLTIGQRFSEIYAIDVDGQNLRLLRARNDPNSGGFHRWSPAALPDGAERIAYGDRELLADGSLGNQYLFLMETNGSNPTSTGKASGSISWSPDATRIAVTRRTNGLRVHEFGTDTSGNLIIMASPRYDLEEDVVRVAWSKTQDDILAVTVKATSGYEIWEIDLRDAVVAGMNSDGTPLFSLTTHAVLSSAQFSNCDWSSDDSELIFEHGQPKPTSGLRNAGCWILGVDPYAAPALFYKDGYSPAWRR